ncbi:preprotein translocase [Nocardiopsis sp. CNT-189]|uniref:YchJ family protein n=1 Tax=Nocardiopsis oceanisediminis TaxID=2816862 RepID=UPI003B309BEB
MPRPRTCPCGHPRPYTGCCAPLHNGRPAATAEELMRSRYTAYALGHTPHLLRTWHPRTRPAHIDLDPRTHWTGLNIHTTTGGTAFHTEGTVDFTAHYLDGPLPLTLRENSRFLRHHGHWTYLDAHP